MIPTSPLVRESLSALFAFLHHGAAFTLFAALVVEHAIMRGELTIDNAKRILTWDRVYGIAAGLVVLIGFLRVFFFEKGPHYYFHSATFIAKISFFALVGLLSIYPTVQFLTWRQPIYYGVLPVVSARRMDAIRMLIGIELGGLVVVILCAALMARGIGYFG
jgi:putative membrane protein